MLKPVLLVPFTWFPDPVGGTEIYVNGLARGLRDNGVPVAIAAAAVENSSATLDGLSVHRYATSAKLSRAQVWDRVDPVALATFDAVLDRVGPALVHFHGHTSGISLAMARRVKERQLPLVLTYHTASVSCSRGTLLRLGEFVCDGRLLPRRCSDCVLQWRGVPSPARQMLAALPPTLSARTENWPTLLSSVLGTRSRVESFTRATRQMFEIADRVVAVCDWVARLLLDNGVSPERLLRSRQGLREDFPQLPAVAAEQEPLRMVFLGRAHPYKGIDLLIDGLRQAPELSLRLQLFLVIQDAAAESYVQSLRHRAAGDTRIDFQVNLPTANVLGALNGAAAMLVPSRWLETGPLTVLEAFAAGIPVLGSRIGGIPELVRDGTDGWLAPVNSPEAWAEMFRRACREPSALAALRANVRPPRRSIDVVADHLRFYRELLA